MRLKREATREQPTSITCQSDHGAKQRMIHRYLSNRDSIPRARLSEKPIMLTLEGISGKPDPLSIRASEQRAPIHNDSTHPHLSQRAHQRLNLRAFPTQQRHRHNRASIAVISSTAVNGPIDINAA